MFKLMLILLFSAGALLAQDASPDSGKNESNSAAPPKLTPPRVRTGVVVNAQFTTEKPAAGPSSRISKQSSAAWAVLTLELDPGRAASIFDYVLSKGGTEYPCLDIAEDNESFTGKLRIYSSPNSKICRLAFAVPSAQDEYEMIFKLVPDHETPVKLNAQPSQSSPSLVEQLKGKLQKKAEE